MEVPPGIFCDDNACSIGEFGKRDAETRLLTCPCGREFEWHNDTYTEVGGDAPNIVIPPQPDV